MADQVYDAADILVHLMAGAEPFDGGSPLLGKLFSGLRTTLMPDEAKAIEQQIWDIWSEPHDGRARLLLGRAMDNLAAGRAEAGLRCLDNLVGQYPTFAEGWNKRATFRFMIGDLVGATQDVQIVLVLEPRHFGALSGLGQIFLAAGRTDAALRAFQSALTVHPHLRSVRQMAEDLRQSLGR